jgi:hypothetical protein
VVGRSLALSMNNFTGTIPAELLAMTSLTYVVASRRCLLLRAVVIAAVLDAMSCRLLDLCRNALEGEEPPAVATRTDRLSMRQCGVTCPYPEALVPRSQLTCMEPSPSPTPSPTPSTTRTPSPSPSVTPNVITDAERLALEDLYNLGGGASWLRRSGWMSRPNPCSWEGVHCIDNRVVYVACSPVRGALPRVVKCAAVVHTCAAASSTSSRTA